MMRLSTTCLLFLGLCGVFFGADNTPKVLEGSYSMQSMTKRGDPTPPDFLASIQNVIIKDGRLLIIIANNNATTTIEATIHFDPANATNAMDVRPITSDGTSKVFPGIYVMLKDELTICWNETSNQRPAKFTSSPEDGCTLLVLKKK